MSTAQLAKTRKALEEDLRRLETGGYGAGTGQNGAKTTQDWRSAYEQERVRLAKLLVLYRDLQEEAEDLRERLDAAPPAPTETVGPAPRRARRRARRAAPFEINGYTLYRGTAARRGGGMRPLHFFAKRRPKSGRATRVPPGFEVRTTRSGLPVLRRAGTKRPATTKVRRAPRNARSEGRRTPNRRRSAARRGRRPTASDRGRALAFARDMKRLRARARGARGGRGPIAARTAAKRLRAKYGY